MNRGRKEWRQLTLQNTSPEQSCFVAAAQIGLLRTRTRRNGKKAGKDWAVITSASPKEWPAAAILQCRREYWGIEGQFHQRLDATLHEDLSRVRTPKAMMVLGMFRRLVVSFASAWMACPKRRKQKLSTIDFQRRLALDNARRAFSLVTSTAPKAWIA